MISKNVSIEQTEKKDDQNDKDEEFIEFMGGPNSNKKLVSVVGLLQPKFVDLKAQSTN